MPAPNRIDPPAAEPAMFRTEPPLWLHAVLRLFPAHAGYAAWRRVLTRYLNLPGLENQRVSAHYGLQAALNSGWIRGDASALAEGYARRILDNKSLLFTLVGALSLRRTDLPVAIVGLEALYAEAERPVIFLGSHFGAADAVIVALAKARPTLHTIVVSSSRELVQRQSGYFATMAAAIGVKSEDWLQQIVVPDARATISCLTALRRGGALHVAIDTDFGVSEGRGSLPFLGRKIPIPKAIYKVAQATDARIFQLDVGPAQQAAGSGPLLRVRLVEHAIPGERDIPGFHEERLRQLERKVQAEPDRWTLWKYWRPSEDQ